MQLSELQIAEKSHQCIFSSISILKKLDIACGERKTWFKLYLLISCLNIYLITFFTVTPGIIVAITLIAALQYYGDHKM